MPYLDPYSGNWSNIQARHLLRRTTFGPSQQMVDNAVGLGLTGTLNSLLSVHPLPDPPLKYSSDGDGVSTNNITIDPDAPFGETWVNGNPFPEAETPMLRNRILRQRANSIFAWTLLQMQYGGISITEKMTLFWHNHFVVSDLTIPHRTYQYQNILRSQALGNFKQMTKDITIDTSMLIYLSGAENTNQAPNENYARELLELFTVGKGPLTGPGDYTNYNESDIVEIAKILTGWRVLPITNDDTLTAQFSDNLHNQEAKNLSHHFNNAAISNNGEDEYKDLIDIIFEQDECSRFIMRKIFRWFVDSEITQDIEDNIIEPLALILRNNNYEVIAPLRVLFESEYFYQTTACMIKSPLDMLFSITRALNLDPSEAGISGEYEYGIVLGSMGFDLEQAPYFHTDVSGWKAYYQEPQYYKTWINSYLLPKRLDYCKAIIQGGEVNIVGEVYNIPSTINVIGLIVDIPDVQLPNNLINGLAERLFPYPLTNTQLTALKEVLIPGLPDFEWTLEYLGFLENPTDNNLALSIDSKLRSLIATMVQMPEFQVM